jgi:hypothetical protein
LLIISEAGLDALAKMALDERKSLIERAIAREDGISMSSGERGTD